MKTHFGWSADRSRRIVFTSIAVGLALSASSAWLEVSGQYAKAADAPEYYNVQVVGPFKQGARLHMHREIEDTTTESSQSNGKPQASQSASMQINFSGELEVVAVDAHGEAEKWKVTAGAVSMQRTGGSSHEELVKPGTEFTVAFSGGKATIDQSDTRHPFSEDAKKFLPIVFEATGAKGDASLGKMLDTASASKGTNWNLNSKAVLENLRNFDPKIKPSEITGTAHIKSVVGEGDKKTLLVDYEFKATTTSPANPPAGMTPVSASRTESGTVTVPANQATGYFSAKSQIHITGTFKKTYTKNISTRLYGTKSVKVNVQTVVDENAKVNTLLTYGGAEGEKKSSPSPSTAKSTTPASQGAASSDSSSSADSAPAEAAKTK